MQPWNPRPGMILRALRREQARGGRTDALRRSFRAPVRVAILIVRCEHVVATSSPLATSPSTLATRRRPEGGTVLSCGPNTLDADAERLPTLCDRSEPFTPPRRRLNLGVAVNLRPKPRRNAPDDINFVMLMRLFD
jgi:hypothetical protein